MKKKYIPPEIKTRKFKKFFYSCACSDAGITTSPMCDNNIGEPDTQPTIIDTSFVNDTVYPTGCTY